MPIYQAEFLLGQLQVTIQRPATKWVKAQNAVEAKVEAQLLIEKTRPYWNNSYSSMELVNVRKLTDEEVLEVINSHLC